MTHVVEPAAERPDKRRVAHRPPSTEPVPAQREVTEATARSAPPMSARGALLLQRQAGNRATARLLAQRKKTTAPPQAPGHQPAAVPAQRSPAAGPATTGLDGGAAVQRLVAGRAGPGQDPKFAALKGDVRAKQRGLAAHPPAQSEAKAAQGAAKPPQDDKEAQGKAANAEKMNAAKPGEFDKAAFIKAVNDAIAKQAPKNLDEADKFGDSGKADAVKGEVQGKVGASKDASAKAIETTTKAPPDTAAAKEKPVTPLQPDKPPPKPGTPNPDQAVPDKAPPSATDFSDGPKQVDKQMTDAQVTEEQLAKSNEPEFTGALKEKKAGEAHAATAPGQVRASEAKTLTGAKAAASQAGAAAMTTMTGDRVKAGQQVGAGKEGAKGDDEKKREQVTAKLQKVFDATKKEVEDILNGLDKKVDDKFSAGEKAARDAFTADYTRKIDDYKDKRYSGVNFWKWGKDKLFGLPDEVNAFYDQARQGYVNSMQGVISSVADVIGAELTRAKQRITTGRAELQAEVKKLPADLQAIGKQAAGEFEGKFDELTQSVNDKGTQLVDTLASKYTEALKAVDDEIASEKEKNKGLVAKAIDAVKGVIDTILKLKDLLLGVLAKAAQAVGAIIKDPIGFLGHLVSSVGAGLKAFMANIATHLQKGLVSWLLGAAAAAGLQLPAKFDLKGILLLIGSLLGLTWAAIRGRVVQRGVPEQAMSAVESSVPMAQKIQSEGIGGVWEEIKDKVGDLKQNLLGKITEYLIPTVIIAGITWLISLLTPASAFIKACKAIIDIVTFIIDRGAQIIAFVNAVLDAVIAIAGGGAGGVPGLIETALATAIPVLIGFLAALLGIGGLADKVKKFFQALSKPVMKAVDWVVGKIVSFGKKIWTKIKSSKASGVRRRVADKFRGARDKFGAWRDRRRATAEQRRDERDRRRGIDPAERRREEEQAKQARLDRALAALRPKVDTLFNRGVTGLALKSQLFAWRLQHRLSSLSAVRNGESVEIWATVNPRGMAGQGIEPDHAKLRSDVNQVVRELLSNANIRRRYYAIRKRLANEVGMSLPEGVSYLAGARALRRTGRSMRVNHTLTHAVGQPPDQIDVQERKRQGKTNAQVLDVNSYPEIANQLDDCGLKNSEVARELRSLITTGRVSAQVTSQQRQLLGVVSYLMVEREGARNPRNLAHVGMTLDLVENNKWTWQHAFAIYERPKNWPKGWGFVRGRRGAYPMSMEGAAAASRGLNAEDQKLPMSKVPEGAGTEADRRELEAREYDIVEEWMMLKLETKRNLLAHSPNTIREHIRRLLLDFFAGQ